MASELYENKTSILMKNIIKNIQNTDIYDSQFLLERREDYDDEEEGCIENSEDEKEKIILS